MAAVAVHEVEQLEDGEQRVMSVLLRLTRITSFVSDLNPTAA